MFKNMTLGARIAGGFTLLILIAMLLGGLAVFNMKRVEVESNKLALEYVPEVGVANEIERASLETMYAMRGYGLSQEAAYLETGKEKMALVQKHLDSAKALAADAPHLVKLPQQIQVTETALNEYVRLAQETEAKFAVMDEDRAQLDASAQTYMKNCLSFLEGQNEAFKKDLADRQQKLSLVSAIVDLGTKARVLNFKAQATKDTAFLTEAITALDGLNELTGALRPITKDAEDLQRIDNTEAAASGYQQAMGRFLTEFKKGSAADQVVLEQCRAEMDKAAGSYVENCSAFFEKQQAALEADMSERHKKINLVADIVNAGNNVRLAAWRAQAERDPQVIESGHAVFTKDLKTLTEELRAITRLDSDIKRIEDTVQSGTAYGDAMLAFVGHWKELQQIGEDRGTAANEVLAAAQATAAAGMEQTDAIAHEAAAALSLSSTIMVGGLIAALVIGVLLAFGITRSITGPVRRVIQGLAQGSDQVSSAANQVSASSQQMAQGASEQASSLEETSASLEEMGSMTRQNADNAEQANGMMREAHDAANQGREAMGRMSEAIFKIKKSSDETAKIIKTIDEIAFQTNLLALNAAVEAARAGDAGKGFAVVAEEVRGLAQRSAEAAKNTSELIAGAQENADNGVGVSEEVGQVLERIAESVEKVTQLIAELSSASGEQAQGIDQINSAMAQIDQVTQSSAASSEEAASASEELSAQATELNDMVMALTRIVGGGNGEKTLKALPLQPGKSERRNTAVSAHSALISPEKVIPLDDDDF